MLLLDAGLINYYGRFNPSVMLAISKRLFNLETAVDRYKKLEVTEYKIYKM